MADEHDLIKIPEFVRKLSPNGKEDLPISDGIGTYKVNSSALVSVIAAAQGYLKQTALNPVISNVSGLLVEMPKKVDKSAIINNLNSSSPNGVLSAAQGRVLKNIIDGFASQVGTGILGEATPETEPTSEGFGIYTVSIPGVYTNFLDLNNIPIEVTENDLSGGLVQLWGGGGVWEKQLTPVTFKESEFSDNLQSSNVLVKEDVIFNLLDQVSGHQITLKKQTFFPDGSLITQSDTTDNNIIYEIPTEKGGGFGVRTYNEGQTKTLVVDNVDSIRNLSKSNVLMFRLGVYTNIRTEGYYTPGDGGGAEYLFNSDSVVVDDGFLSIKPNLLITGRFVPNIKNDTVSVKIAGATTAGNQQDAINKALNSPYSNISGDGLTYNISAPITIPTSKRLYDIKIQLITPGQKGVLMNNYSRFIGTVIGTGATGVSETGVYPAVNGVHDTFVDVGLSNVTYGVHYLPLPPTGEDPIVPYRNEIHIKANDIVGVLSSGGYAFLGSPINDSQINITAKNVKRHVLYLSVGSSRNVANVNSDGCGFIPVNLQSYIDQDPCEHNTIYLKATNTYKSSDVTGDASEVVLSQKCNYNKIHIDSQSEGLIQSAIVIQGVGTEEGPHPDSNEIYLTANGSYLGSGVIVSRDAINTMIVTPNIAASSTNALILMASSTSSTYNPSRSGEVRGGTLNGMGATNRGISITTTKGVVDTSGTSIIGVTTKVNDPNLLRIGRTRNYVRRLTFTSVASSGSSQQVITLPISLENQSASASINGMSTPSKDLKVVITSVTSTTVTVVVYNDGVNAQASVIVLLTVIGD